MAYRNKTFVSFASEDIRAYRLMCAWRRNTNIAFNFHDAHDLNVAYDTSQPETIKRRLRERLSNTKQVVLLISGVTRTVSARPSRFLHYEVEVIHRLGLPVVFANVNGSRSAQLALLPRVMANQFSLSVSFQPRVIQYALDDWVGSYARDRLTTFGPHEYKAHVYARLGI